MTHMEPVTRPDPGDAVIPANWDEALQHFAEVLRTDKPVPLAVLHRAMHDSVFAHRLMVSRNSPAFLDVLFNDPENARYLPHTRAAAGPDSVTPPGFAPQTSNAALLKKAASAIVTWGKTGFTHAAPEVFARRMAACERCPNLRAPSGLVQRLASGRAAERTVCDACGCVVRHKARMSTETCPAEDPDNPGASRWGDRIGARAEAAPQRPETA